MSDVWCLVGPWADVLEAHRHPLGSALLETEVDPGDLTKLPEELLDVDGLLPAGKFLDSRRVWWEKASSDSTMLKSWKV